MLKPLFVLFSHCNKAHEQLTLIEDHCYRWVVTNDKAIQSEAQRKLRLHTSAGYPHEIVSPKRASEIIAKIINSSANDKINTRMQGSNNTPTM